MAEKFEHHAGHIEVEWLNDEDKTWYILCNEHEEDLPCHFVSITEAKEHLRDAIFQGLEVRFKEIVTCRSETEISHWTVDKNTE